jgi:lincosamide nucleotidyltransferase A/C/D/E
MSQETEDLQRVTSAADVIALLALTDELGIQIWMEGGWAVDANLGRETRRHADVDIVVELSDLDRLVAALGVKGYVPVPRDDTRPENFVLGDRHGREVDFHVIEFDPVSGDGIYGPVERCDRYPREALSGRGSILGRDVRCITPDWLVRWHTGYELDADDVADVTALCAQFGIPLPDEYVALARAPLCVKDGW